MGQDRDRSSSEPLAALVLGAVGVVYGDIGTSPLYALRECFAPSRGLEPTEPHVLGVLSLIFWSLAVVVCVKYLVFVMRADNRGEGGVLALLALTRASRASHQTGSRRSYALLLLGLFGAALLYGDGMITPAISVLSAVEGLSVAAPALEAAVPLLTVVILIALFAAQRRGTRRVAVVFGPVLLVWFVVIGVLGLAEILRSPDGLRVLAAIDPRHAISFFGETGPRGFLVLGAVVLVVTGGEALYADMGHFGARPIRIAWFAAVLPSLLANYFGQGALLLGRGGPVGNPFYDLAPPSLLLPLVALATAATIVASQALISGVFSLTQQAIHLGFVPRFTIVHTSPQARGQIYVPSVNYAVLAACIALVLGFETSSNLANAYGMAVTGTMSITSILFFVVVRERWRWSLMSASALVAVFLVFDLSFLAVNLFKLHDGALFPLVVGAVLFSGMVIWRRGRAELERQLAGHTLDVEHLLREPELEGARRIAGTAVVLTAHPAGVPGCLLHQLKHFRLLHERVILLSFVTGAPPFVEDDARLAVTDLGHGFWRIVATWGFMEQPDIRQTQALAARSGLCFDVDQTSFILGRETILPTGRSGMGRLRARIFSILLRNAPSTASFFGIPQNRVVELGSQMEL